MDKEFEAIVLLLLQSGANLEVVDKKQQTVLHCAAKNGRDKIALKLLEFGAKIDGKTKKVTIYLFHVGFLTVFKLYNQDERTALHMAADFGHDYVASVLLGHGANVNMQDKVSVI